MNTQKIVQDWITAHRALLAAYDTMVALETEYVALDIGNAVTDTDTTPLGFTAQEFVDAVANWQAMRTTIEAYDTSVRKVARGNAS
jgi:regulator of sigma D